ncbi:glycosyltransferase [Neoroseomonas oryzicola]|uniref:Glycosyltransferase family 4 protein n=1 Tax=Neoroseomonas oryzicola TaxID=535904 RepID=A0A9X9WFL4_9PROT|nr:glycosyltransferase [Neoroseomonas oryzicola]MBR0659124.1 glycosyltransferase family 4 protein [Neoroseomonas oryzicola]NKE17696.1 glycosyltransferase family 4 protein [Neoroseomonas oryzicola]
MPDSVPGTVTTRRSGGLRILLTNIMVATRSGTEIFIEQLADWFRRAGHTPIVYAPLVGPLGEAMRSRGHHVHDRIGAIEDPPDVIHGHHAGPTMTALAAFPAAPAIFVSHSVEAEFDRPPEHPGIRRHFAVSSLVAQRWASPSLPASRIEIMSNAVDLDRFAPRPALPPRPRRAALVTKYGSQAAMVREACAAAGLELEEVGAGVGRVTDDLPGLYRGADIVFASGRSALEAAATGCAVVLTEGPGLHGMIRPEAVDRVIAFNWGIHLLARPPSVRALAEAIAAYDPAEASEVARRVRRRCGLDSQGERLLGIYAGIRSAVAPNAAHHQAIAGFLESHVPSFAWDRWRVLARHFAPDAVPPSLLALAEARRQVEEEEAARVRDVEERAALQDEMERLRDRIASLETLQAATYASTSWRVTTPLRSVAAWLGRG